MDPRTLPPDDRAEYNALLVEAVYDPAGQNRPTHLMGVELGRLLDDAVQAGRSWAMELRQEALSIGLQRIAKDYLKALQKMKVWTEDGIQSRSAVFGSPRKNPSTGRVEYVQLFLPTMGPADIRHVMALAARRRHADEALIATGRHLLVLCDRHPEAPTLQDALDAEGTTFNEYLDRMAPSA